MVVTYCDSFSPQVFVAPAAPRTRRPARTHRTETANCPTTRTLKRNTAGTGPRSPPSSFMSWREPSRSPTTRTCTAERSWHWRSTYRRSASRCVCAPHCTWVIARVFVMATISVLTETPQERVMFLINSCNKRQKSLIIWAEIPSLVYFW